MHNLGKKKQLTIKEISNFNKISGSLIKALKKLQAKTPIHCMNFCTALKTEKPKNIKYNKKIVRDRFNEIYDAITTEEIEYFGKSDHLFRE